MMVRACVCVRARAHVFVSACVLACVRGLLATGFSTSRLGQPYVGVCFYVCVCEYPCVCGGCILARARLCRRTRIEHAAQEHR